MILDFLDFWIFGFLDFWIFGFLDFWIFGFLDFWIFGISCAHFGTVAQCSVDPRCASSAKTKHLETSQKLSEPLKNNHETSRK